MAGQASGIAGTHGGASAAGAPSSAGMPSMAGSGGSPGAGEGGQAGEAGQGGSTPDDWTDCPTSSDFDDEATWPHTLEVTEEATYCATFSEFRTLKEELAKKALLRVAPGTYRLPATDSASLGLPLCIKAGANTPAIGVGPGELRYQTTELGETSSTSYGFDQAVTLDAPAGSIEIQLQASHPSGQAPSFVLDGSEVDLDSFDLYHSIIWCESAGEDCSENRIFDSCTHESSRLNLHQVETDAGSVSLELRIGQSFASTEPGAFVRASGTYRGQSFEQTDYFKLVYRPSHHHFERNFAVLFDSPIEGACGLEVSGLEPFDSFVPDEAYAVNCELDRIDTLIVESHELTQDP